MYAAQLSVCGSTEWWHDTTENIECDVWETQLTKIEQYKRGGSHKFVSCGPLVVSADTQRDIWRRMGSYRSVIRIKMMIDV
jgi:single-stranded DNA-binding protein